MTSEVSVIPECNILHSLMYTFRLLLFLLCKPLCHPPSTILTHPHPISPTLTHIHQYSPTFIHIYPHSSNLHYCYDLNFPWVKILCLVIVLKTCIYVQELGCVGLLFSKSHRMKECINVFVYTSCLANEYLGSCRDD